MPTRKKGIGGTLKSRIWEFDGPRSLDERVKGRYCRIRHTALRVWRRSRDNHLGMVARVEDAPMTLPKESGPDVESECLNSSIIQDYLLDEDSLAKSAKRKRIAEHVRGPH